jgi:hypothetical protein
MIHIPEFPELSSCYERNAFWSARLHPYMMGRIRVPRKRILINADMHAVITIYKEKDSSKAFSDTQVNIRIIDQYTSNPYHMHIHLVHKTDVVTGQGCE